VKPQHSRKHMMIAHSLLSNQLWKATMEPFSLTVKLDVERLLLCLEGKVREKEELCLRLLSMCFQSLTQPKTSINNFWLPASL